jgi:hypothetical protein
VNAGWFPHRFFRANTTGETVTEIQTNQVLLDALEKASSRTPSFDEMDKQRLSFVMGALPEGNDMTREEVQEVLERQEGRKLAVG